MPSIHTPATIDATHTTVEKLSSCSPSHFALFPRYGVVQTYMKYIPSPDIQRLVDRSATQSPQRPLTRYRASPATGLTSCDQATASLANPTQDNGCSEVSTSSGQGMHDPSQPDRRQAGLKSTCIQRSEVILRLAMNHQRLLSVNFGYHTSTI